MIRVTIGVGSNVDPEEHVRQARDALREGCTWVAESEWIRTPPVGPISDQPDFLNGVILVETDLDRWEFDMWLKELELALGRDPDADRWGPRTIDLDILTWNGKVVDDDVYEREFLRAGLAQVCPEIELRPQHDS